MIHNVPKGKHSTITDYDAKNKFESFLEILFDSSKSVLSVKRRRSELSWREKSLNFFPFFRIQHFSVWTTKMFWFEQIVRSTENWPIWIASLEKEKTNIRRSLCQKIMIFCFSTFLKVLSFGRLYFFLYFKPDFGYKNHFQYLLWNMFRNNNFSIVSNVCYPFWLEY